MLVASGDLSFGGRARHDSSLDFSDFVHNEAPSFGGAGLTPQDPLAGIDALARQVDAAGIRRVAGDVLIDDRLFDSFHVPNGNPLTRRRVGLGAVGRPRAPRHEGQRQARRRYQPDA